ncbi:MAG: hypothetical protein M3O36_16255 [Myxococcota bacterium]|nr:hypothetical protein [Myxococcota bacterium]
MATAEEIAEKRFAEEDRRWTGPRFIALAVVTLVLALSLIYFMSTSTGCSLQIVP